MHTEDVGDFLVDGAATTEAAVIKATAQIKNCIFSSPTDIFSPDEIFQTGTILFTASMVQSVPM